MIMSCDSFKRASTRTNIAELGNYQSRREQRRPTHTHCCFIQSTFLASLCPHVCIPHPAAKYANLETFPSSPRKTSTLVDRGAPMIPLQFQRGFTRESTKRHTVEVDTFDHDIAPVLGSDNECLALVNHVTEELTARNDWSPATGWISTAKVPGDEDATFKGLAGIAKKIHDVCVEWDKDKQKLGPRPTELLYESRFMAHSEVLGGSMITDSRSVRVISATPNERRPTASYKFRESTKNPPYYGDDPVVERHFNSDVMAIYEGKLSLTKRAEVCPISAVLC